MIALIIIIICRCLVDLVVGLIRAVQYIKKFCHKKNKISPQPNNEIENQKNRRLSKKKLAKNLDKSNKNKRNKSKSEADEVSKSSQEILNQSKDQPAGKILGKKCDQKMEKPEPKLSIEVKNSKAAKPKIRTNCLRERFPKN